MEFQKIVQLLESADKANILLALELAKNYQSEFENYSLEDYKIILEWVWEYFPDVENPLMVEVVQIQGKN